MDVRARIALLVNAQGARRAATDVDRVGDSVQRVGRKSRDSGVAMKRAEADAAKFRKGLSGVARAAKIGAIGAAGFAVAIGVGAAGEYREAYKAGKQTDAVLKSTGHSAHVSAKDIGNLANSISLKSGIDDEAIQSSENMLLTFTKVRNEAGKSNDIFSQATQTITDMSVALGTDGKKSAIMLGKALNDPVKGITALQRVGVTFDAGQKKQIKTLVKHGKTLQAQRLILRELNKEFGGSAAAQADPLDKATVAVKNLEEAIGFALAPTVTKALVWLAKFVNQMSEGKGAGGDFKRVLIGVGAKIANIVGHAKDVVHWITGMVQQFRQGKAPAVALGIAVLALTAAFLTFKTLTTALNAIRAMRIAMLGLNATMLANPAVLIAAAIVALGVALFVAYHKVKWFHNAVDAAFSFIKTHWPLLVSIIGGPFGAALVQIIKHFRTIKSVAVGAFNAIKGAVQWVIDKVSALVGAVGDLADKIGSVPGLKKAIDIGGDIAGGIGDAASGITGLFHHKKARGGSPGRRGPVLVGEDGPEVVNLNSTDHVTPRNRLTRAAPVDFSRMFGDGGVIELHSHVHIDGREVAHTTRRVALHDALAKSTA